MKTQLSIITPTYNEEESITQCINAVAEVMQQVLPKVSYEHIISDNKSTDTTVAIARKLAEADNHIKIIVNSRNIGAPKNIYRAMGKASGLAIIPMLPADLQDPVDIIPIFYNEWLNGNLIVFGARSKRLESLFMRILRGSYYRIIRRFSSSDIPINVGEFMLVDGKVVKSLLDLNEHNPYIRGMVAQTGVQNTTVSYTWGKREFGKSKATPFVLIDTAINGLVTTSRLPARLAILSGFLFSFLGILLGLWSFLSVLISHSNASPGIPTLIIFLSFFGGIQLFFLGLIGEYVLSIHGQIRPEPEPFDLTLINFDK